MFWVWSSSACACASKPARRLIAGTLAASSMHTCAYMQGIAEGFENVVCATVAASSMHTWRKTAGTVED